MNRKKKKKMMRMDSFRCRNSVQTCDPLYIPYHSTGILQVHETAKPVLTYEKSMKDILIHQQGPSQLESPPELNN